MRRAIAERPRTTLGRVLVALGSVTLGLSLLGLISTVSGWRASPALGPHSPGEAMLAGAFVFGLWTFYFGIFLALFAGLPWALLHAVGLRSWWVAPLAAFPVAFCLGFLFTSAGGRDFGLHGSAWIDGKATMIDGQLTTYGKSLYGPAAAAKAGALAGLAGAAIGLLLWRIAYRTRDPAPKV